MIQYSPTYANYGSLQGPFVVDNNLVRSAPRKEQQERLKILTAEVVSLRLVSY
jgi:hypothetical protein